MDAIIDNRITPRTEASSEPPPSLLVLILDTSPIPWSALSSPPYDLPLLPTAISQLILFINAHLALSQENRVAILAAHCGETHWLYPSTSSDDHETSTPSNANKYRPFAVIEHTILTRLSSLLASTQPSDLPSSSTNPTDDETDYETPLSGALTLALSYINRALTTLSSTHPTNTIGAAAPSIPSEDRLHGETTSSVLDARILIVSVTGDLADQYIPLMNAMFAAQHLHVPIDILKLAGDSVLLQQISHTTGGVFITPASSPAHLSTSSEINGDVSTRKTPITLLPALFQAMLPTPSTRVHLTPPQNPTVDFRAACFCHRRVVDLGFVCSICLSIFCDEGVGVNVEVLGKEAGRPMACPTCGSELVLAGRTGDEGAPKKKKKKRREGEGE